MFFICRLLVCLIVLNFVCLNDANATEKFIFPVDCKLGVDCITVNYVDMNASDEVHQDYNCGRKTYEGHKGTDFAIRSWVEMKRGVNVFAAADGKVLRLRDGEADEIKREEEFEAVKQSGRECGNGVIIEHPDKMLSYYCHLKKDSIMVKAGDSVKAGDVIAQIGQSGLSEFPHLHFTLIKDGHHVDPFSGSSNQQGCGVRGDSYWASSFMDAKYEPFTLYDGGFDTQAPDFEEIKKWDYTPPKVMKADSKSFVYWIGFYHAVKGDEITMRITDPEGNLFEERHITLEANKKRRSFYYLGRNLRGLSLKKGVYTGSARFIRRGDHGGIVYDQTYHHRVTIE